MTNLNLIVTSDTVYGTYVETICFKANYTNKEEMESYIAAAKLCLFNYGLTFGKVFLNYVELHHYIGFDDAAVFEYLSNQNR